MGNFFDRSIINDFFPALTVNFVWFNGFLNLHALETNQTNLVAGLHPLELTISVILAGDPLHELLEVQA